MLRGKRAVITGGGGGFGQALCVWLAREGVEVDFCARRADDIKKTCNIITADGGIAKGYVCDLTQPDAISQFSSQLLTSDKSIDILILNAAQWLSGSLDDQPDTEIISTISSGLTGSILLTQALLPGLRRSESADIVSIISSCGIPNFTDSIAHPAFFASKHGLSGFTNKLSHLLSEENIRVTGLYPPDFELTGLDMFIDSQSKMGERLMNGRSIWETIRFVLGQPRSCHISSIYFEGPTREKLGD
ncbi:putative deoxygluconate dehydrogenase [Klebsiella oxytoca]|uniref:SDR family oxidoreductase n=1 Tax=Serratia marcescens TaxID=615 RepID=UPI0007CBDE6E|nr:SDR family oxidoreductase [Serratia marcescens]SAQ01784.1 putative deoxygluconate dehydrogenase [Klebsiella oxytoca]AWQ50502.1 deoxygluconate dehydrogenase [Serratia marcescens]HEO8932774.1 SDR family oxidoreductase [Serratia marcescens]HEP0990200.1 SDR family oxidoreductase [Serratia marcescens]HEP0992699.1 SDR family oxidoreductase [Serratia marcescens]